MVLIPYVMAITCALCFIFDYIIHFIYKAPVLEATTINGLFAWIDNTLHVYPSVYSQSSRISCTHSGICMHTHHFYR